MRSYGHVTTKILNKDAVCKECEQPIEKGTIYVRVIGERGRGLFPTKKQETPKSIKVWVFEYHEGCWLELFVLGNEAQRDMNQRRKNHEPGLRNTRLHDLTPEQRKRRKALQTYITSRDIPALISAYERQLTNRVYIVMATIAERWKELAEIGAPFTTTLTPKNNEEQSQTLKRLILKYDWDWLQYMWDKEDITLEEKIAALVRTSSTDQHPPKWDNHIVATSTEEPESQLQLSQEENDELTKRIMTPTKMSESYYQEIEATRQKSRLPDDYAFG